MNGEVPEGLVLYSTAPGGLSPYPPTPWQGLGKGQGEGRKGRVKILVYVIRCGDG